MPSDSRRLGSLMRWLAVVLVSLLLVSVAMAQERAYQLPTATEVFKLRSACAELGERILEDNIVSNLVGEASERLSNYNPRTNRCYVQLKVYKNDTVHHRYLFDGQTKELLASSQKTQGSPMGGAWDTWGTWGIVFDKQHRAANLQNNGWDDATAYIDEMMADDRR